MDELERYALDHNLDIIGVVETWLNDSALEEKIVIKDYITYLQDRAHVKEGRAGGVL